MGKPDPQDLLRLADEVAASRFGALSRVQLLTIFNTAYPRQSFAAGRDCDNARHRFVSVWEAGGDISAAMMLVPPDHTVQLSDWDHPILREKGPWQAIVLPLGARGAMQQFTFTNRCDHAATAAAALTAAALRARAHSTKETSNG